MIGSAHVNRHGNRSERESSDRSLLRRFRAGEEDAATALYLRYAEHLRSLAKTRGGGPLADRVDPEDIVQSVFRTFFRRAARDGYDVPEGDDLWKLFLVIALNKIRGAAAFHRAARRDVGRTARLDPERGQDPASTNPSDDHRLLSLVIEESLEKLPESSREIVRLRVECYEVAEIAERTGRSKRTVERVLQRFRDQLRAALDVEDP